jgi:peroxiredoxin
VNEFYRAIQERKDLKDNIKLIGIGAGNTPFEVDFFRKKYAVPFPLFADQNYSIHKALGEVRTPYFIGVKINDDGGHKVFYSELRGFKNPSEFLKLMLKLSGLH